MPNYKAWIYSVNYSIIICEVVIAYFVVTTVVHPRWKLIPIKPEDLNFFVYGGLMLIQLATCIAGIVGIWLSHRPCIVLYWILTVPLLILDVAMIFPFTSRMALAHVEFDSHLETVIKEETTIWNANETCPVWKSVEENLGCCMPSNIRSKCFAYQKYRTKTRGDCRNANNLNCSKQLRRWMHTRTDIMAILIYYVLFPLRFIVVIVLREDMHNVFYQIVYSKSEHRKSNWDLESDDRFTLVDGYSPFLKRTVIEQMIAEEQMSPIISAANSIRGSRD